MFVHTFCSIYLNSHIICALPCLPHQSFKHNWEASSIAVIHDIYLNFYCCICMQINENINLFCQARNNILAILSDLNDMPELMKQMPPLPVKLNEDLANSILPRSSLPKKS
ncbi:histone H2A deubiquitinase (DUF3755) [Olea europaea subsp. europaea]|uniref:Histone H2A deubiquitinase (DUF3755) n=1 Tax=Olea europaea subsp. europaea TaxID=158383 RepID=A0A8S0RIQ8_OLEEU|nr:histone H2A deubiquitinase (DUF3755) [Olea europaea subsp. europaea]